ncbi:MAG: hypothetical protein HY231_03750 [Acidobacteria bacterium]|nr:hypothetical protein [Acidobacteriota bacterium]
MIKTRRKVFWLIALLGLGGVIIYFLATQHIFRAVSWDGHDETDVDGSRIGVGSTDWKSTDGVWVFEVSRYYSSPENARNALEKILENHGTIIERKKKPKAFSDVDERIIKSFTNANPEKNAVTLIKLRNNEIYFGKAASLEAVLAFERAWLKLEW